VKLQWGNHKELTEIVNKRNYNIYNLTLAINKVHYNIC